APYRLGTCRRSWSGAVARLPSPLTIVRTTRREVGYADREPDLTAGEYADAMRVGLAVIAVALVACTEHGKGGGAACVFMGDPHQIGEHFPAGDGCNDCTCDIDGVHCTLLDCFDGGTGDVCGPSNGCSEGPACAGQCCAAGERCD